MMGDNKSDCGSKYWITNDWKCGRRENISEEEDGNKMGGKEDYLSMICDVNGM